MISILHQKHQSAISKHKNINEYMLRHICYNKLAETICLTIWSPGVLHALYSDLMHHYMAFEYTIFNGIRDLSGSLGAARHSYHLITTWPSVNYGPLGPDRSDTDGDNVPPALTSWIQSFL